jgi:hypothetical protein
MFPDKVPPTEPLNRIYMVVVETVLFVGVSVIELAKPVPDVKEISNPDGADTVMLPVRSVPDTVIDCSAEGVPRFVENAFRAVVETDKTGAVTLDS